MEIENWKATWGVIVDWSVESLSEGHVVGLHLDVDDRNIDFQFVKQFVGRPS